MSVLIELKNISKSFAFRPGQKFPVLQSINLSVMDGEFLMLLGPSGSGKSTLLRIISGLDENFQGTLNTGSLTPEDMGFVFQSFALLPWLTVAENVALGLIARKVSANEREAQVRAELKMLGLDKFAHAKPRELSGGMKQRVGIARALVTQPKILLLDEPFASLDSFIAEELRQELLRLWQERHMTVIMVTHMIDEALELADRVAVLTPRPGKIEKMVPVRLVRPRQKRAADFFELEDRLYEIIKP